jgi:hypothetical protein
MRASEKKGGRKTSQQSQCIFFVAHSGVCGGGGMVGGVLAYLAGVGRPLQARVALALWRRRTRGSLGGCRAGGVSSGFGEHLNVIRVHFPETLDF